MRPRLFLAFLLIALVLPVRAYASGRDVLRDCADDEKLSKTYTQKEYRDALNQLATDSSEYSNCENVIRQAQLDALANSGSHGSSGGGSGHGGGTGGGGGGSGTGGGSGGGSAPSGSTGSTGGTTSGATSADPLASITPEEQRALDAARTGAAPSTLDTVPTGSGRAPNVTGDGHLPGPVVGLLILFAAVLAGVMAARIRTRVIGRHST
jgi:hypothetical protein